MSVATPIAAKEQVASRVLRPSFFGLVRGELFKARRQLANWILLIIIALAIIVPYLILLTVSNLADQIQHNPSFLYNVLEIGPTVLRVFSGFFLLILTARLIGLEYRLGTIRILLARGVGRVQLLCAKLLAVVLIALALLIVGLLLSALMLIIVVATANGNLDALQKLPSQFWSDAWTLSLTIMASMGVTILLATALAVIGRASAFGLAAALAFFPLDNIGTEIMQIGFLITHNDFWLNITAYFLGPNLNAMPHALVSKFDALGATPLYFMGPIGPTQSISPQQTLETHGTLVDGTHTLVVVAAYAAIFVVVALWLTWKRDVQE
ncbi:MAG TPA: ABC transporter permease subunit [Ktedonobacteraceae bacterium]|jgi:ABC-type transport system involved in multi-copper enzyme maturation permease subunit|nr:ABC transporter permease subunit [Ktedonobacteraceae bacterium]